MLFVKILSLVVVLVFFKCSTSDAAKTAEPTKPPKPIEKEVGKEHTEKTGWFSLIFHYKLPLSVAPSHQHRVDTLEKEPQKSLRVQHSR